MRKRSHFIGVWLDDAEYRHLTKQCELSGLCASAYIRHSVMGAQLRPRPPDTLPALLRELQAIGNNANQIAYWANARKSISEADIRAAAALVYEAARLVKEAL